MATESPQDPQEFRQDRLAAAAKKAGGNAPLGRLLGYRDGAFVGQMLRGDRPITEKTVAVLESKPGYQGWFAAPGNTVQEPPAPYSEQLTLSPLERDLVLALRKLPDEEQTETVRDVMHRAEVFEKLVKRELARRGIDITGYISASRAAEKLPAPPAPPAAHSDPAVMKSPLTHKQVWPKSREGKS